MTHRLWITALIVMAPLWALAGGPGEATGPDGSLTVAVATFGNERWLPHLYVGAEDIVLKPLWENLLTRDAKGDPVPMLAERWQVLDGGRTWKFHLRKGIRFHNGIEMTAEDVKFTFTSIARAGSANSLSPEFRLIKSMEVEDPHTITVHFGSCPDCCGKEKWRILPVGKSNHQPTADQGGQWRNAPWTRVAGRSPERMRRDPSRWAS